MSRPPLILGVDPGLDGAFAFYDPEDGLLEVHDMPTLEVLRNKKRRRQIDYYKLANLMDCNARHVRMAYVEQVSARPGEAPDRAFTFGKVTGVALMAVCAHLIPHEEISPAKWKRDMCVTADKDSSRRRASQLLPRWSKTWPLVKHDGRAEAALLALWGSRQH